ncbi:MAG: hypothetical protein HY301_20920 [Verrucomicrobia bacterium]|nr:hypothetical protein [Verrucomicrobiota bacterium]
MNYKEARPWVKSIREKVVSRAMPPWPLDRNFGKFAGERGLTPDEINTIVSWVDGGAREGDPKDLPPAPTYPAGWQLGKPDAVFEVAEDYSVPSEGVVEYQHIQVPTNFTEDRWIQAAEIRPGNRAVVHHVIVKVHPKGANLRDAAEGVEGYWAAYVPGNAWRVLPEGFGKMLPAGATISFQIHYTPNGKAVDEQMRIGLKFAAQPPTYAVHVLAMPKITINIPPGAADHVEVAEQRVPFDLDLTAFMAHMHVRGKAFKYEATYPDGRHETLLDIPHYDFNWQLRYECAETKRIPAGSTMKITAVFDNSAGNPANPDPTKIVRWGPQTFNEMMIGYMEYYTLNDGTLRSSRLPRTRRAGAE